MAERLRWPTAALALAALAGLVALRERTTPDTERCLDEASDPYAPVRCVKIAYTLRLRRDGLDDALAEAASRQLDLATSLFADSKARDEAASLLVAAGPTPAQRERLVSTGASTTALSASLPLQPRGEDVGWLHTHSAAAAATGDLSRTPALARALFAAQTHGDGLRQARHPCALHVDARACLSGDSETGVDLLSRSICGDMMRLYPSREQARRLALVACGAAAGQHEQSRPSATERLEAAMLATTAQGGPSPDRPTPGLDEGLAGLTGHARLVGAALQVIERPRGPADAIVAFADMIGDSERDDVDYPLRAALVAPFAPCFARDPYDAVACHTPAAAFEQAATSLERAADSVDEPLATASSRGVVPTSIRGAPRAFLRRKAFKLRLLAAVAHADRGQPERARAALSAPADAPSAPFAQARVRALLALDDNGRALALIDREAAADARDRPLWLAYRALALAARGDHEAARQAIFSATEKPQISLPSDYVHDGFFAHIDLLWLRAALAHKLGQSDPSPPDPPPPSYDPEGKYRRALERLRLVRGALASAGSRAAARQQLELGDEDIEVDLVSPWQIYLIGELVRGQGEVEVYLDRAFSRMMLSGGRRAMRARQRAADMRGDEGAASLWRQRAARLDALVSDERRAVLAAIAGL